MYSLIISSMHLTTKCAASCMFTCINASLFLVFSPALLHKSYRSAVLMESIADHAMLSCSMT